MSVLDLYGLKNCDSCRKAQKALDGAGRATRFHDIRESALTKKQLREWAQALGWENLLNKRSTTFRALDEANKANLNELRAIALMAANPTLIKRPVIVARGEVSVGWTPQIQRKFCS